MVITPSAEPRRPRGPRPRGLRLRARGQKCSAASPRHPRRIGGAVGAVPRATRRRRALDGGRRLARPFPPASARSSRRRRASCARPSPSCNPGVVAARAAPARRRGSHLDAPHQDRRATGVGVSPRRVLRSGARDHGGATSMRRSASKTRSTTDSPRASTHSTRPRSPSGSTASRRATSTSNRGTTGAIVQRQPSAAGRSPSSVPHQGGRAVVPARAREASPGVRDGGRRGDRCAGRGDRRGGGRPVGSGSRWLVARPATPSRVEHRVRARPRRVGAPRRTDVLRYRPVPVIVRAEAGAAAGCRARRRGGLAAAGRRSSVSSSDAIPADLAAALSAAGVALAVEDAVPGGAAPPRPARRPRAPNRRHRRRAARLDRRTPDVAVWDNPVTEAGRVEMLPFLRSRRSRSRRTASATRQRSSTPWRGWRVRSPSNLGMLVRLSRGPARHNTQRP